MRVALYRKDMTLNQYHDTLEEWDVIKTKLLIENSFIRPLIFSDNEYEFHKTKFYIKTDEGFIRVYIEK